MLSKEQKLYPPIHYSPSKYPIGIHSILQYMDLLDEEDPEDREMIREVSQKLSHLPEAKLAVVMTYLAEGKYLKSLSLLQQAHEEHPDHIPIKAEIFESKYSELELDEQITGFKKLFENELKCLFKLEPLGYSISDTELRQLLLLAGEFYNITEKEDHVKHLFVIAKTLGFDDIATDIAYKLRNKEMPLGFDIILMNEIRGWKEGLYESLSEFEFSHKPIHTVFYAFLNKQTADISRDEIAALKAIDDRNAIRHDLLWLMQEGLFRTESTNGECNLDYYINALYITAYFDLHELTPLFLDFLQDIPEAIHGAIVGDIGHSIIGPPFQKLASKDLSGFAEMLTYEGEYDDGWYIKTVILNTLGSLIYTGSPNSKEAEKLLIKLWKVYEKKDNEMLGWLLDTIRNYQIDGFEDKIENAYKKDHIDTFIHGTYGDHERGQAFMEYEGLEFFTDLEEYFDHFKRVLEKNSPGKVSAIEKQMREAIKSHEKRSKELEQVMKDIDDHGYSMG